MRIAPSQFSSSLSFSKAAACSRALSLSEQNLTFKSHPIPIYSIPESQHSKIPFQTSPPPSLPMATTLANSPLKHLLSPSNSRPFSTFPANLKITHLPFHGRNVRWLPAATRLPVSISQLKEKWLDSLSCPFVERDGDLGIDGVVTPGNDVGPEWVVGIDPDVSGALALLKVDGDSGVSAQVFDTPHVEVLIGKRVRKRLDAKSIVELLRSFEAPHGTAAYIEQSNPFPKDGKQGWWSGGFGYGLWIGILVASGFSVIPVPSLLWKNRFDLSGSCASKDDSRKAASILFPSLSPLLKRKKDHGRAEALLIAAYGKGLAPPGSCNT